ncbi:MAG: hypothetical protein NTW28_36515 [Candidatus Solibacter sp.]|nr:hypothetical protein [Candidatus Solibacter sp.]
MMQFDKDGVTLFYVDANGKKISHNYMEGTAYDEMLNVRSAQIQAIRENTQTEANYTTALGNLQASVDAGRPHDAAPAKPLQKIVSDNGEVSYTPFVPPLPDLVIPKTIPSGPIAAPTVDKQAIMYNMILAMFRKMFPEA